MSLEGAFGARQMVKPNQGVFHTQRGSMGENGMCKAKDEQDSESKTSLLLLPPAPVQGKFRSAPHLPPGDRVSLGC